MKGLHEANLKPDKMVNSNQALIGSAFSTTQAKLLVFTHPHWKWKLEVTYITTQSEAVNTMATAWHHAHKQTTTGVC